VDSTIILTLWAVLAFVCWLIVAGGAALAALARGIKDTTPELIGLSAVCLTATGAASLPYLRGANRLAAALIARRPEIAPQLAERISGVLLAAGVVAAPALNQLFQP